MEPMAIILVAFVCVLLLACCSLAAVIQNRIVRFNGQKRGWM